MGRSMSIDYRQNVWGAAATQRTVYRDVELRAHMLRVYNMMASGLALTGLVAWFVANTPALLQLFFTVSMRNHLSPTLLGWVAMLAPLGVGLAFSFGMAQMKASTAQTLFWVYAGLVGISLSTILITYTGVSVARTFFITAASFGSLSLWGYTTRKDLTGFGSFLIMGLFGLVIASLVNLFLESSMMQFIISVLGVLIFAGLTAYDTQKIKMSFFSYDDAETASKKAIIGAFELYLDFINLFLMLIRFLGDRRD